MASLSSDKNGNRTIQFVDVDKKRRSVRLGKMSKRQAESIKRHVEHLVAVKISGAAAPDETTRWLATLDAALLDRLARVGLAQARATTSLGDFLAQYIADRDDVKPNTIRNLRNAADKITSYFGGDRELRSINEGDAEEWQRHLIRQDLSAATISRTVKRAKQFYIFARKKRLVGENPFADLAAPQQVNEARMYFVSAEAVQQIIEACPDAQWRLIVALCRFAAFRCPSELLALKWGCIDWERDRITILSPKTEHHRGGESRVIPLFPTVRPYLEECFELAEPGTEHVITRYRQANCNLRTQLQRIMRRAGVEPWPRLFQNLRASAETEWATRYPQHVAAAWAGNSQPVAAKHYLQVTDDHFQQAVHFPVQSLHAPGRNESQADFTAHEKTPVLPGFASQCDSILNIRTPPRGIEPLFSD